MSIIGLSFDSVHGNRDKEKRLTAEMKVNSVPRINDVKEVNVPTIGNKKVLSLTFEFVKLFIVKKQALDSVKTVGKGKETSRRHISWDT